MSCAEWKAELLERRKNLAAVIGVSSEMIGSSTGIRDHDDCDAAVAANEPTKAATAAAEEMIRGSSSRHEKDELKTCITATTPTRNNNNFSSILVNTNNIISINNGRAKVAGHSHSQYAATTPQPPSPQQQKQPHSKLPPIQVCHQYGNSKFIANNSSTPVDLESGSSRENGSEPRTSSSPGGLFGGAGVGGGFSGGSGSISGNSGCNSSKNFAKWTNSADQQSQNNSQVSKFKNLFNQKCSDKNPTNCIPEDKKSDGGLKVVEDALNSDRRSGRWNYSAGVGGGQQNIKKLIVEAEEVIVNKNNKSTSDNQLRKVGISSSNSVGKMVAAQEICEENVGRPAKMMDSFDTSEELNVGELKYGPGIVRKLRTRFMSYTLRLNTSKGRPSLQNLRRATSLNNLLDDGEEEVVTPNNNSHDGCSQTSDSVEEVKSQEQTKSEIGRSRQLGRGNESLKRARSVETLRYDSKSWERDIQTSNGPCQLIEEILHSSEKENINGVQHYHGRHVVTIEDKIINARERGDAKPCRLKPFMDDTERPPPDLVKTTLRKFEATANRRGRPPTCRNGEVAAKVASYKSIIEKPPILYPKPPLSPKKPMVKPRTMVIPTNNNTINSIATSPKENSPLITSPKATKSIILQPNVIQRSPSPLTIRVDMTYRSNNRNNSSNLLVLSPNSSSSGGGGLTSPGQLTPINNLRGNNGNSVNQPDLINNISAPRKPAPPPPPILAQQQHLVESSSGGYESPMTQLTNKLKSMHLQTTPKRAQSNEVGGGGFVLPNNSTSTPSSSVASSPVSTLLVQNGVKDLVKNGVVLDNSKNQEEEERVLSEKKSSDEEGLEEEEEEDDDDEDHHYNVNSSSYSEDEEDDLLLDTDSVKRINKNDLENISSAGTTQEFRFNSVTSNSTPIKKSHLPQLNGNAKKMRFIQQEEDLNRGKLKSGIVKPIKDGAAQQKSDNNSVISRTASSNVNSHISNSNNHHVKEIILVDDDSTSTTTSLLIKQIKEEAKCQQLLQQQQQQQEQRTMGKDTSSKSQSTIRDKLVIETLIGSNSCNNNKLNNVNNHNNNLNNINTNNGKISSISNSGSDIENSKNGQNNNQAAVVNLLTNQEIEKNLINREKSEVVVSKKVTENSNSSSSSTNSISKKKKPWQEEPQTNTMVFNFSQRKDVPDYIDGDGLILMPNRRRELPKPGESGFVLLGDIPLETSTDPDDSWTMGPPSPCNVEFENDNVIINGKSNLRKQVNNSKWSIRFDDSLTTTFEYISESSYLENFDDQANSSGGVFSAIADVHNSTPKFMTLNSAPLGSYTPVKGAINTSFELGVTRSPSISPLPSAPRKEDQQNGGVVANGADQESLQYLKPASDDQTVAWSEGTCATDLLF